MRFLFENAGEWAAPDFDYVVQESRVKSWLSSEFCASNLEDSST